MSALICVTFSSPLGFWIITPDVNPYTALSYGWVFYSFEPGWMVSEKEEVWPHQAYMLLLADPDLQGTGVMQGLAMVLWIGWVDSSLSVHSAWKSWPQLPHPQGRTFFQIWKKSSQWLRIQRLTWSAIATKGATMTQSSCDFWPGSICHTSWGSVCQDSRAKACSVLSHYPHSMSPGLGPPSEGHLLWLQNQPSHSDRKQRRKDGLVSL